MTDARLVGRALSTITELEEHEFCSAMRATSATGIAPWGPWAPAIDAGERRCQLRCLSGLIAAYRGSRDPLIDISIFGAVNFRRGAQ